jgi:radical SAM protein with 4Fe4S-binding SPASM domain
MSKKMGRYQKKISNVVAKSGITGLYVFATEAFKIRCHRILLKNQIFHSALNSIYRQEISNPKVDLVYLELTNNCNLSCEMCTYKKVQERIGYMSSQLFESCVDQISEMGANCLYLHGAGESLLHPNFKDYLKYAISKRDQGKIKSVAWVDNGMLFNQSIADLVVDLKVDEINFSLDGVGKVNDTIRVGSIYSIIERNIKYLISKRGKNAKPKVTIGMVDYGKTEEQKSDVYREWTPFADSITLTPALLPDNSWGNKNDFLGSSLLDEQPPYCHVPFNMMIISWNGTVSGCCVDYCYKLKVGNALKEPLTQIWGGPKYQALRRAVLNKAYPVGSPCNKCDFWKINFVFTEKPILNGEATIEYRSMYRTVRKVAGN